MLRIFKSAYPGKRLLLCFKLLKRPYIKFLAERICMIFKFADPIEEANKVVEIWTYLLQEETENIKKCC